MAFRKLFSGFVVSALVIWLLGAVVLGSAVGFYLRQFEAAETARALTETQAEARFAGQSLLRTFDGLQAIPDLLRVRQAALHRHDREAAEDIEQHLRDLVARSWLGIAQIGVVDLSGIVTWGAGITTPGFSLSDRDYIRAQLGPNPGPALFISAPVIGRAGNRMILPVSAPIFDPDRRLVGVGVLALDPYALSRSLFNDDATPSEVIIVRRITDGVILARSRDPEQNLQRPPSPDHPAVVAARAGRSGNIVYSTDGNGRRVFAAFFVPGDLGLVVTALRDVDEALQSVRRIRVISLIALATVILLGLVAALYWAERRRILRHLEDAASRDPLTGLHNRRSFEIEAARALKQRESLGGDISFLLADMDHFKAINDRYGHAAGDQVLRDIGKKLSQGVRRSDIVCRWGGEEIAIMLPNCPGSIALELAERLRRDVQVLFLGEGEDQRPLSISIGIAMAPMHGTCLDEVMREADKALYRAKRQGRNTVVMLPLPGEEPALADNTKDHPGPGRLSFPA